MKVDLAVVKPRGVGKTKIEWADYTANPVRAVDRKTGAVGWSCVKVSPGCANCYAEAQNRRFGTGHGFTAEDASKVDLVLDEGVLQKMLRFSPKAPFKSPDGRAKVFLGDMCDLFEDRVPFAWIDQIMAVCALRAEIDWLWLTKRPERMAMYFDAPQAYGFGNHYGAWVDAAHGLLGVPSPKWVKTIDRQIKTAMDDGLAVSGYEEGAVLCNTWLGTSIERPEMARRAVTLSTIPAALRFLSVEPLLLAPIPIPSSGIHWVIVGGESGPHARQCPLGTVSEIVADCKRAGVPVFVKQMGSVVFDLNVRDEPMKLPGKGGNWDDWPRQWNKLKVRQWPRPRRRRGDDAAARR